MINASEQMWKMLLESIQSGKEFLLTQAPDVIQQLVTWKRVELSLYVIIGVLCLLSVRRLFKNFVMSVKSLEDSDTGINVAKMIGNLFVIVGVLLLGFILTLVNVSDCLKVWFAPKIYLIEYLSSLLK